MEDPNHEGLLYPQSDHQRDVPDGSKLTRAAPNADDSACCIDCGSGRTACDDGCIRKLAAMQCRATCGTDYKQHTMKLLDAGADKRCAPAEASNCANKNADSSCGYSLAEDCCDDKSPSRNGTNKKKGDGCTDNETSCCSNVTESYDRCGDQKGSCTEAEEKDNCYADKKATGGRTEEKDACCAEKGDACCAEKQDDCHSTCNSNCDSGILSKPRSPASSLCGMKRPRMITEACDDHLQQAFSEYSNYLRKGRCVCRSVLDRLDACCGQPVPKKRALGSPFTCYGTSSALAAAQQPSLRRPAKTCKESCCEQRAPPTEFSNFEKPSGCALDDVKIPYTHSRKFSATRTKEVDLENAAAREHVFLGVSGMTCTGCSRKITSVLNNVNGVSSVRVTFVTGVVEFDLNLAVSNLQQVIPRIEKETGFKFAQIVSNYQALDLRIDPAVAKDADEQLQDMSESVEKLGKWTYRVKYDPAIIGARSLLSSIRGASLAPPGNDATLVNGRRRLLNMACSTGLAAVLTIPIIVLAWSDNPVPYSTRSIVSLVLATFIQILAVPEFYAGAIKSLVYSRVLETDMLIVISITAAYAYSVVAFSLKHAGYNLETEAFFETSSLLITLVLLGRLVAAIAKVRAVSAVSLRSLQAEMALLVEASGDTTEIDARLLQFDDVFVIPAHSRVVTDGEVIYGQSSVDESMITGESVPLPKATGDEVIAGTINGPGTLTVRMTRLPGKNSITDIANLVDNALAAKPHVQNIADTVASYFIAAVIAISLVAFGIWMAVAMKLRGKNGGGAVGIAITYSIAVLAVSCPCALALAVPMVLVIAGGVAARNGVIIKQADAIERGYKVTDVVFDKTGTLTKGDLNVVHEQSFPHTKASENDVFSLAKSLTKDNQHPISLAVAAQMQLKSGGFTDLENVESIPGAGIRCTWRESIVKAGNPYWLEIEDHPEIATLIDQGMILFCVTLDSSPLAAFGLKSNIRDEASAVVAHLHHRNVKCHIVSGDGPRVVEDVANAIGIPLSNIASRHSPAEKQKYVKELMSAGSIVLFCGDGTNDAVAVAQANVGVQIGTASDVTRATADVVLLGGLDGVPVLLDLSKRSFHRIIFNFVWSAIYNVFGILLAGGAFVKVRIPPAYAGLGEIVSVVPVIIAATTLLRVK